MQTTRRGFLAATAALGGTIGAASTAAADDHLAEYRSAKPPHVTLSYDQGTLEHYQPSLDLAQLEVRPTSVYAWTATSPEYDYDVQNYVVYYQTQYGTTSSDSHRHDREIVQVYTDPELGEVREAVYSAGHWTAFRNESPNVYEASDGGRHVTLRVVPRWHHYVSTDSVGTIGLDIEPLGTEDTLFNPDVSPTQYETFLENGWAGYLRPGALQNPDIMRFRESYWAENRNTWNDRLYAGMATHLAGFAPAFVVPKEVEDSEYRG